MRSHENEPFVVNREVKAVIVPAGRRGQPQTRAVRLHHAGARRQLHRLHGGQPLPYLRRGRRRHRQGAVKSPELPPNATENDVRELAWAQMRTCYDPEIPINIVDLGLVYDCTVQPNEDGTRTIEVRLTLTAPGCGMGDILVDDVKDKIERIPTVREASRRADLRSALEPEHDVRRGSAADRDVLMPWVDVGSAADLSEATPLSVEIDGLALVVVRCGNDFTPSKTDAPMTVSRWRALKSSPARSSARGTARGSACARRGADAAGLRAFAHLCGPGGERTAYARAARLKLPHAFCGYNSSHDTNPSRAPALGNRRTQGTGPLQERARARGAAGRHGRTGEREVLNFCANNYLGLANHPAVREAAHRAIDRLRLRDGLGALHLRHPDGAQGARGGSEPLPRHRGHHPLLLLLRRQRRPLRDAAGRAGRDHLRRAQPRQHHRRRAPLQGPALPLRQQRHGGPGGSASRQAQPAPAQADRHRRRVLHGRHHRQPAGRSATWRTSTTRW